MNARRRTDGFTLIELLIVIVVIGVLAAIAVPKLNITKIKGYRSAMLSDLKTLATAQELYHVSNFTYANSSTSAESVVSQGVTITVNESSATGWSAVATHAGVPDGQCAIYMGDASPVDPATTAGVPACDF